MTNLAPRPRVGPARVEEAQSAWDMYIAGASKREIARRLNRNRDTVNSLIEEAAVWYTSEHRQQNIAVAVERQRKIVEHAWQQLESGNIKATSLAGPQYLLQIREANKEIARLQGLHITRSESVTANVDLATLVQQAERLKERQAADDVIDVDADEASPE